jgi:CheY-like chemotaxis protein
VADVPRLDRLTYYRQIPEFGECIALVRWGLSNSHFDAGKPIMPRILVVDDDPLICTAISTWLEAQRFDVVTADGGATGLRALEISTFDLMIVDIFMPEMNGFESIRVFHQRTPLVPLITISGYVFAEHHSPAPDFLRMALELGATRCLRKPFTPRTLLDVIDACLLESASRRKSASGHP